MKKIQFGILAAVLLLGLFSCTKDRGPISFPVNTPDAYEITAGQKLDIDLTVENLMDGQIAVEAEVDNADYDFDISEIEGDSFTITVTAPDFIKEQTVVNMLVEVTDMVYDFRQKISKPITITAKPAANLSRVAKKANCLISEPGKILCFKAFVGNSESVTDFDSAKLIWQDKQSLVSKVAKSDDEIVVWLADGVCGNALVGAYKNNTLVWTYHVWVINDNPAASLYEYTNADGVKFSFMDRNVGALDASFDGDAYGLYYYWGNKNPYAGGLTTLYDIEGNALEYSIEETATICSENELDDIHEYSLTRPMTMFFSNSNKTGNYEWLFIHKDKAKWTEKADLWGAVSGNKSIYDPCPVGYKVPPFAALDGFKAANATQEKNYNGEAGYKTFIGWKVTNDSGSAILPAAGDYNNSVQFEAFYDGENTFPTAYFWAADLQIDNFRGTALKGTPSSLTSVGQAMGYALNVRCIKE